MNGLDPYREIKKVDARVKVCFLTALSDLQEYEDFKKEVFQEGEGYSIVKPIDNEELLKRVNEMITVNDPLVASSNTRPLC
jgi:DNA-binding response OmpR family regulator